MSDYLAAAASMVDAVPIPVVADCDTGYGNSNNVIRMVRKFEAAGVAGVCIEDKLFPKVNSLTDGRQELAPIAEFVGKLLAAKTAQRTSEFVVIARIEALIAGWSVAEAVRRADAYARAGADAILIHDKHPTAAGVREFLARWDGAARAPIVVVPTAYPQITIAELDALGIKMVVYANQGIRAAVCAMQSTYRAILADGTTQRVESSIAPMSVLFDLQGMPDLKRAEHAYLRSGLPRTRAVILTAGDHGDAASMRALASEVPLAALDVSGKSLLQRQVETLARAGIRDVSAVTGYRHESVQRDGVRVLYNADWATSGEIVSLMCVPGDDALGDDERTLVIYGDVLFDADLIDKLMRSEADATIVVDRTTPIRGNGDGKHPDLVALEAAPTPGRRFLNGGPPRAVRVIGKQPNAPADAEFAGIALFSSRRWRSARERYERLTLSAPETPVHESPSMREAALTDLLQLQIDDGEPVVALEITSGWLEIHSFEDYQLACRLVAR
jgi:phosphoenolpyruvate phosphomutase